jgi:hypothetical protein
VALAVGVVLLPIPFINVGHRTVTAPASPAWPAPPAASSTVNVELQKIQYQAQVDEVTKLRTAQSTAPNDTWFAIWVGLIGLALVVVGGAVARGKDDEEEGSSVWRWLIPVIDFFRVRLLRKPT